MTPVGITFSPAGPRTLSASIKNKWEAGGEAGRRDSCSGTELQKVSGSQVHSGGPGRSEAGSPFKSVTQSGTCLWDSGDVI